MSNDVNGRVFAVLLSNRGRVEAGLSALAKRAARKGLGAPVAWSWGQAYTQVKHVNYETECAGPGCGGCAKVSRIPLTLTGDTPHYDGWHFAAALEHMDGENVVRAVPGVVLPTVYRTRGSACDHCKANRRRNATYVLRHDDGRLVQVGSSCLEDFLGAHADAYKLAAVATMLGAARGLAEDGCEDMGGGQRDELTLDEYLPVVAWCVRAQGWVSRTAARERGSNASADLAMMCLTNAKVARELGCVVTDADIAEAEASVLWAESLTDAQVDAESGDYLHNLRVVARSGLVARKTVGIGASMVVAYQRAMGRERARAERPVSKHVGTVGKRECWAVNLDFVTGYETDYGYTTVLKFRTDDGSVLVWKASSTATGLSRSDVGKRYMVCGTVKEHSDYKGDAQTIISRCDCADYDQAAWDAHVAAEAVKDLAAKVKAGTATADEVASHKANLAAKRATAKAQAAKTFDAVPGAQKLGYAMVTVVGTDISVTVDDHRTAVLVVSRGHLVVKQCSGVNALADVRKYIAGLLSDAR